MPAEELVKKIKGIFGHLLLTSGELEGTKLCPYLKYPAIGEYRYPGVRLFIILHYDVAPGPLFRFIDVIWNMDLMQNNNKILCLAFYAHSLIYEPKYI